MVHYKDLLNTIELFFNAFRASVCDVHFLAEDVITVGSQKRLRVGAKPCLNLPKPVKVMVPRTPPVERLDLPKTARHVSLAQLKSSVSKLSHHARGKQF